MVNYIRNIGAVSRLPLFFGKFGGYMKADKIQQVIDWIETEPCLQSESEFVDIGEKLEDIIIIYTDFIKQLPELKNIGIDIQEEIILQQVKNLNDAIQHKDLIELYDTLKYEVAATFEIYKEIQMEMEQ